MSYVAFYTLYSRIMSVFKKSDVSGWNILYHVYYNSDRYPNVQNVFSAQLFGYEITIKLPKLLDAAKVQRRNDVLTVSRRYGIRYSGANLVFYYGCQNDYDSSGVKEKRKSIFLPWKQIRTSRLQLFTMDDVLYYDHHVARHNFMEFQKKIDEIPKRLSLAKDHDGEEILVTSYAEFHEWKRGRDGFEWVGSFYPAQSEKKVYFKFDKQIGREKRSWKGGLVGCSVEMLEGEHPMDTFHRFFADPSKYSREIKSLTLVADNIQFP